MSATIMKRRGLVLSSALILIVIVGVIWFHVRYDTAPVQTVGLTTFSDAAYPEDPEVRSAVFANYPHRSLIIEQNRDTHFHFRIEPASEQATAIELIDEAPTANQVVTYGQLEAKVLRTMADAVAPREAVAAAG